MRHYLGFASQEDIDVQYNWEPSYDMVGCFNWLRTNSAKVRADLSCALDQHFGPTKDETLDIFPASRPRAPVLIFIHGGWWRGGTSKDFSLVARGPVARDVTVVVTNYSLCPKVSIAEITRQSRAAVAWVRENAQRFNGDPDRIFVSGHSAGGHQVGMLATTDWQGEYGLSKNVIKAGLPISGLFDLEPFYYSWLQPKLLLTHELVRQQSPLLHVPADGSGIPLLITVGGDESADFHGQSRAFLEAWRASGASADLLDQPGKDHMGAFADFEDPSSPLCEALLGLIANHG